MPMLAQSLTPRWRRPHNIKKGRHLSVAPLGSSRLGPSMPTNANTTRLQKQRGPQRMVSPPRAPLVPSAATVARLSDCDKPRKRWVDCTHRGTWTHSLLFSTRGEWLAGVYASSEFGHHGDPVWWEVIPAGQLDCEADRVTGSASTRRDAKLAARKALKRTKTGVK